MTFAKTPMAENVGDGLMWLDDLAYQPVAWGRRTGSVRFPIRHLSVPIVTGHSFTSLSQNRDFKFTKL